ncbi:UNKNOWN [Stylonychia lemnae]|uniref:Fu domain containing protein n=1 Tax=Stylonychia lemnae TaxID=5949 RepID=A0A078B5K5_STYLE|nr:UNKNOWN [Stylonychia lemnae]|eukprot:CDW89486.1 UNKNOWN [Stylonychia lemnae]
MKATLNFLVLIVICSIFQESTAQTSTPDHYFDFTKVTNVNGRNYVFDQITKDDKVSFAQLPENGCNAGTQTYPMNGPDGLQYSRQSDLLRMQGSIDLELTNKFMIAVWVKLSEGWYLFGYSLDSSSGTQAKIALRARSAFNGQDNQVFTVDDYIFKDYWKTTTDGFAGGVCLSANNFRKTYYSPFGTMGRLYIWKSFANVNSDSQFDRYFFRQNGSPFPVCTGTLTPCLFCVVGIPLPTAQITSLNCSVETKDPKDIYLAYWDFDAQSEITQYIPDLSGNGRDLRKSSLDDNDNSDPFRIYGQGYLFYNIQNIYAVQPIVLSKYPAFTIEIWVRKIFDLFPYSANPYGALPIQILNNLMSVTQLLFYVSDSSQKMTFQTPTISITTQQYPGLFSTNNWHFISITYSQQKLYTNQVYYSLRSQVDKVSSFNQGSTTGLPLSISDDSIYRIHNYATFIYKSYKLYSYARHSDEVQAMVSSTCSPIGTQASCPVCPSDTGKCLSKCNEDQFGENCTQCNILCGHCKGPTKNDCVYCSKKPATSFSVYSPAFGNCSCISGRYYDNTTDKCELCHANCLECFGPLNSQCTSCKPTSAFFPNSNCITSCDDPLVVQGSNQSYFMSSEVIFTFGSQKLCVKCHPYCTKCTGPLNTQCQQCQPQYLLRNGNTCTDVCSAGQFPDFTLMNCQSCHASCATCSGKLDTNCLTCSNINFVQQGGICQAKCNNGFYQDTHNVCQPCHKACASCNSKFITDCGSCNSGWYLEWLGNTCQTSCLDGYYADGLTNQCLMCHYSCETCSGNGPSNCLTCATGFLQNGAQCVKACDDNQFTINGTCMNCDSKCATCFGIQDNQCYSCNENSVTLLGYYYLDDTCYTQCPEGYYPDENKKQCIKCNSKCASCISETYCTSCIYGPYQLNNGECTYFTCLDTQYRSIRPTLSCFECDSSCKTCQGHSKLDCLSCFPRDDFKDQQCLSCSEQPGMMYPIDDTISGCQEICGDGFNYGSFQCDDGNSINGDGCSSACTIEKGFNCTTGSKFTPSICMDNKNPTPTLSLISSRNFIYIQFDEEVTLSSEINSTNVKISITGQQSSYKFDWKLGEDYKTQEPVQVIALELSIYQSLKGNGKEQVTVEFLSSDIYKDQTGNGMVTNPMYGYLNAYSYIDPETKAKLDAAGDSSMVATFAAMGINLGISLVFGGSISAMWTMVNTIQLVSLLPLCNINYPQIAILVFQKMLGTHGESKFIPNLLYEKLMNRPGSTIQVESALNDKFEAYGWEISNFLYLSGRKIIMWTGIIVAYPFVWYFKKKYSDKHKYCKLWIKVEQKFRYTMLLRGVIMSYVSMYLAFVLGLFKMNLTTLENTISAFTAIAFGIILTYLPIQLMNILQRNYEKIQSPKFMLSYNTIVKEVDLSHPIRYMYYPVFLLRRAVFAISLVLFAEKPKEQAIFMAMTAVIMIIYVVLVKPQKDKVMIILTAVGELLIFFLHLFSLVFLDETLPEDKANQYGWFLIVLIGMYILVNWVIILSFTIRQMMDNFKINKKKKQELKLKQEQDQEYQIWKKRRQLKNRSKKEQEKQQLLDILDQNTQSKQLGKNSFMTDAGSPSKNPVIVKMEDYYKVDEDEDQDRASNSNDNYQNQYMQNLVDEYSQNDNSDSPNLNSTRFIYDPLSQRQRLLSSQTPKNVTHIPHSQRVLESERYLKTPKSILKTKSGITQFANHNAFVQNNSAKSQRQHEIIEDMERINTQDDQDENSSGSAQIIPQNPPRNLSAFSKQMSSIKLSASISAKYPSYEQINEESRESPSPRIPPPEYNKINSRDSSGKSDEIIRENLISEALADRHSDFRLIIQSNTYQKNSNDSMNPLKGILDEEDEIEQEIKQFEAQSKKTVRIEQND